MFYVIALICWQSVGLFAQTNVHYQQSYNTILAMLEGTAPMSLKRAVFSTESAYLAGGLDTAHYNQQLQDITEKLQKFIKMRGISRYKTAPHFAAFHYMTQPDAINDSLTYTYDFEDIYGREDYRQTFISKLLDTRKGNCHSLPFLYKLLTDEMGAESFLALAPNHLYIKHIDETGSWVNLELTNGHPSSDGWIISSSGITTEAIKSGIYMSPLSETESVALCLLDMAFGYEQQYGQDTFYLKCIETTLQYFPNCISALMMLNNYYVNIAEQEFAIAGNTPQVLELNQTILNLQDKIDALGYREAPNELKAQWEAEMEAEMQKRAKK